DIRSATALELYEDLRERLGDEVVDVRSAYQLAGHPVGRLAMAFEQLPVGSLISRTYARDQLGVARCIGLCGNVAHGFVTDLSATYDGGPAQRNGPHCSDATRRCGRRHVE